MRSSCIHWNTELVCNSPGLSAPLEPVDSMKLLDGPLASHPLQAHDYLHQQFSQIVLHCILGYP